MSGRSPIGMGRLAAMVAMIGAARAFAGPYDEQLAKEAEAERANRRALAREREAERIMVNRPAPAGGRTYKPNGTREQERRRRQREKREARVNIHYHGGEK